MVRVIKSEWHQVEKRYAAEIDEVLLSEAYPDLDEEQIGKLLAELKSGEADVETVISDAEDSGNYIDWDWLDEDDWWTDRKGGYEVTYSVDE